MKLAIAGASGKMGQMLIEAALAQPDLQVAVALDRPDSPMLGRDCAETLGRDDRRARQRRPRRGSRRPMC